MEMKKEQIVYCEVEMEFDVDCFYFYKDELKTDEEILEHAHSIAIAEYGNYKKLTFEVM